MEKKFYDSNMYLLKYTSERIRKTKNPIKLQEFRRMKKIAQNNLYNNNNLRKKNLWEILAGV